MMEKLESNSESGWLVFLDSIAKQAGIEQSFPKPEIAEQLTREWEPYLVLATETIQ
jgi:hypothetical protein